MDDVPELIQSNSSDQMREEYVPQYNTKNFLGEEEIFKFKLNDDNKYFDQNSLSDDTDKFDCTSIEFDRRLETTEDRVEVQSQL